MATIPFLDRVLPRRAGARRFAAIAGPHGIHVVEYGRERGGLTVHAGIRQPVEDGDPEGLAEVLADAIESLGGRGGTLSLALGGLGTAHHILSLPPAEEAVLRPIVRRELLRYYPDLDDPIVDYVLGPETGGVPPKREVLVGAVPRRLAMTLARSLAEREIRLEHLTVLPEVLQTLYDTFSGSPAPGVMVLVMETGLLVGCFYQGALRLFIEPPQDVHGRPVRDADAVVEQVERANLFLRQQFPTVRVTRVLLAAPAGEHDALADRLQSELDSTVVPIADAEAGSLAALGAALDAETSDPLQVLPPEVRPPSRSERWTRRLAAAAAVVAVAAAVWWAGGAMALARGGAEQARTLAEQVGAERAWLAGARSTLEARQAHRARVAFLERTAGSRAEVRRIMGAVAAAAGPGIRLDRMDVARSGAGWSLELRGRAEGSTNASAVRAIDALYRGVPDRLPTEAVELRELGAPPDDGDDDDGPRGTGAPVAMTFHMSFIVQWPTDSAR